jgi:hypothetical protein
MNFLNPAILWGLAAVSVPILIHLFNLRKTKTIEFSTLMFLKEIQQTKYRRIKLKQLLILICRILFITFLVLSFSRPVTQGYLGFAGKKIRSSILIILDNSFSMMARDEDGIYFDKAKKNLIELTNILSTEDEIYYTSISDIQQNKTYLKFNSIEELKDSIKNSKISEKTISFNDILYYSNSVLQNVSNDFKEIILVSDCQKTFFEKNDTNNILNNIKNPPKLNIVDIGKRAGANISVDTVFVYSKILERNKEIKVKCRITNHNDFDINNKSIVLTISGNTNIKSESVIELPAKSTIDMELVFKSDKTGFINGKIELSGTNLSEDEIVFDNKRFFTINIPDKCSVLIVSDEINSARSIQNVINSYEEIKATTTENHSKFFDYKIITNNLTDELKNNKDYDCIVITEKQIINSDDGKAIIDYSQNGCGLLLFLSENISTENYNNNLFKGFGIPLISGTFGINQEKGALNFDKIDFENPVVEGIYKVPNKNIESPNIFKGYKLNQGKDLVSIISLNNNESFISEYNNGNIKALIYTSSLKNTSSDFPKINIFAPLMIKSILYLSNRKTFKEAITGKDYYYSFSNLKPNDKNDSLKFTDNNGQIIKTFIRDGNNSAINLRNNLNASGNYSITEDEKVLYSFSCNNNSIESFLAKYNKSELNELLPGKYKLQANILDESSKIKESIKSERQGYELWLLLLIFSLFFIIAEFIVARTIV